jgi:CHRD domain-containing protein
MQSLRVKLALGVAIFSAGAIATVAVAHDGGSKIRANLTGYEEVPAQSSAADARLKAFISRHADEITYTLSYSGPFNTGGTPPAPGAVTQAHIHFGQFGVNGGISAFLCGTASNPGPAGTPVCPQPPADGSRVSVTGTIDPADVIGPANQGIAPGEFDELVAAIRAGIAYANIHTNVNPGGEIRGQISSDKGRHGRW